MLFKPILIDKIMRGEKVSTRRPGAVLRYNAKQCYSIQPGRGKKHVGHILMESAYIDPAGVSDFRDHMARDEGFSDAAVFLAYWCNLWPKLPPSEPVQVYRFSYQGAWECCDPFSLTPCTIPAHYDAQDGAVAVKDALTLDPRLHVSDGTPCSDGVLREGVPK